MQHLWKKGSKKYGDIMLGSDAIKTGLCTVTKRADTNSVGPLLINQRGSITTVKMEQTKTYYFGKQYGQVLLRLLILFRRLLMLEEAFPLLLLLMAESAWQITRPFNY